MAPANSFHSQPGAFENPMFENCFLGILRASRCKSACAWEKWGYGSLIDLNRKNENSFEDMLHTTKVSSKFAGSIKI
jgi:hypothetical protein